MSGNDILARVRRAVQIADGLHAGDAEVAHQLLLAAEHCHQAHQEFSLVLEKLRPPTASGEQARLELLQQLNRVDCGDKLLHRMLDPGTGTGTESEIHTPTPSNQLQ